MLDPILSTVVGKITDAIGKRVELFLGATNELKKLSTTFQSIRAVLNDAETKQVADESVRLWLSRLKHVAYDMDDLLDKQLILSLENEASGGDDGSIGNKALARFRGCGPRGQVAGLIKEIRERLDQIAEDKKNYSFINMGTGSRTRGDWAHAGGSRLPTCSLVESSEVIGRDNDKEILINQLVSEGSSSSSHEEDGQVRVVAVVGIGGLGKTTLAEGICNDARVKTHFGEILWVCVTENFDVVRVMKAILEELKKNASFSELSTLQKQLHETLKSKRFLLVLDDMWNDDEDKWNPLQLSLSTGAPGSRILVTTRIEKVTSAVNAAYIHKLQGLSQDDCWKLFSSRALARRKEEDRLKLEGIGKEIVKKCKGVPLSVKVMGSAMRSKAAVRDWQNILDSKIWSLPEAKNKILPALFLSYSNLPAHLKQCFAYCSIYQKDAVMVKDKLVKLWMAQGLIQLQGNREIEDIGAEYYEDLVALSMFQEVDECRGETRCKMHDLLHDLAQFITEDETSIFMGGKSDQCSSNVRHASLFLTDGSIPAAFQMACRNLRTLVLNSGFWRIDGIHLGNLFCQSSFLRVLRMSGSGIVMLTETIGKLKHLRYLDLSYSDIVELPDSVTHLHVLHTLILNSCYRLRRLPSGMERMVSLRHLELEGTKQLVCLPRGLGRLTSLQSLSKFIVGDGGECGIDELHRLNSLQGRLQIEHLERVSSREEAGKAELWSKPHLRTLKLSMSSPVGDIERMGHVLEGLRPHCNLEELEICDSSASKLPLWVEDSSFLNLTRVIIKSLSHCAQLPGLGNLPALEYLSLDYVGVRKLGHEFYSGNSSGRSCDVGRRVAFPKLEQLQLLRMYDLEEWEARPLEYDNGETIMPSLRILKLRYCPKLESLPHPLAKLKDLRVIGCKKIKWRGWCFPLLEIFHLEGSHGFFSSGLPKLPKLKKFQIYEISNETLTDEGWEQLESLEELRFHVCRRLESLPDGLGQLKALKSLEIHYLVALTCLPRGLGQLQSLETLVIEACPELEYLPDEMAQLKALQSLEIYQCEALGSLPRGMRDLPLPTKVKISGCPLLRAGPRN